jgi:hypothetical protein
MSRQAWANAYYQNTLLKEQNVMATKKNEVETVEIRPIEIKEATIRIVGDSPLIMHAWSEKAKRMMLEAQQGKAKGKKKPVKNPVDDFIQAAYWLTGKPEYPDDASEEQCEAAFNEAIANGATFGFPVTAIKQAAISAAYRLGWVKNQMGLRGAFFIKGDENGMVQIHSDAPEMREDMVKVGMGTADIRYRPQFNNWYADLTVQYNTAGGFSFENILNAINAGGFVCGLGEWRPERDGQYGQFHVASN